MDLTDKGDCWSRRISWTWVQAGRAAEWDCLFCFAVDSYQRPWHHGTFCVGLLALGHGLLLLSFFCYILIWPRSFWCWFGFLSFFLLISFCLLLIEQGFCLSLVCCFFTFFFPEWIVISVPSVLVCRVSNCSWVVDVGMDFVDWVENEQNCIKDLEAI